MSEVKIFEGGSDLNDNFELFDEYEFEPTPEFPKFESIHANVLMTRSDLTLKSKRSSWYKIVCDNQEFLFPPMSRINV
jgi:hypothetical protein